MAIALDAVSSNVSWAPATTLTTAHTCNGSDRILFVGCSTNSGTTTWVTYNGVAMTLIWSIAHGGLWDCTLWYLVNPATGTNNIVSTSSVSTFHVHANASFTWASQTWVPDATVSWNWISSAYTNTLTTIADNCFHIAFSRTSAATNSAWSSTTNLTATGSNYDLFQRTWAVTPAWSSTININASSALNYSHVWCSFKPSWWSPWNPAFLLFLQ